MLENGLLQFMTSTLSPLFPTILPRSVPIFQHLVFFCVWRMFLSSDALPVDIANGQWTSSTEALSPDFSPFFFYFCLLIFLIFIVVFALAVRSDERHDSVFYFVLIFSAL